MPIIKKTPKQIEEMKEAGRISALVLSEVGKLVRPGVSTLELDMVAENIIRMEHAVSAFKGYCGFPASICTSVNDEVIHGIPSPNVILKDGDILSIDVGAIFNGWVGDNAWTFPVGSIDVEKQKLLQVTEECMWAEIEAAVPGNRLGDIGYACLEIAQKAGFEPVRDYCGHGVGTSMHEDPSVINYGKKNSGIRLEAGMVLALEPMINAGTYKLINGADGWLVSTADGCPSAHFEKTIAITDDGPIILTEI
ncbi:MAG: type I methionyl aminopeptidase [Eggerthellaceae bacterium]|nr:type I methionyl aminopeptidase [Eggerthellaceae bacterium]